MPNCSITNPPNQLHLTSLPLALQDAKIYKHIRIREIIFPNTNVVGSTNSTHAINSKKETASTPEFVRDRLIPNCLIVSENVAGLTNLPKAATKNTTLKKN
ncbi:hypothetical protein D3C73_1242770 [compost metagenome]